GTLDGVAQIAEERGTARGAPSVGRRDAACEKRSRRGLRGVVPTSAPEEPGARDGREHEVLIDHLIVVHGRGRARVVALQVIENGALADILFVRDLTLG